MKKWLRKKMVGWLFGDLIQKTNEAVGRCYEASRVSSERLRQLNALSAVDLPVAREAGFIVVVTNVQNQPRVHLTYIKPHLTIQEWRDWQVKLEYDFGARAEFIDAPKHMRDLAHSILR